MADAAGHEPAQAHSPRTQVVRALRAWIEAGRLAPGDDLPSERSLAAELGVARGTVRAALEELTRLRLVTSGRGRQRTVAAATARRSILMDATVAVVSTLRPSPGATFEHRGHEEAPIYYTAAHALGEAGLHVLTLNPDLLASGREQVDALLEHRPRGILVAADMEGREGGFALADALAATGLPCVFASESERLAAYDRVTSDHDAGAFALTELLARRGRTRILRMWPRNALDRSWLAQRDAGYARGCRAHGLSPLAPAVFDSRQCEIHDAGGFEGAARFVAGHLVEHLRGEGAVDAIMCVTDGTTYLVARACRLFGLEPGRDVDIVGYDNVWRHSDGAAVEPASLCATVDKHNAHIARAMVDLLAGRLDGSAPPGPQHVVVNPDLVEVRAGALPA